MAVGNSHATTFRPTKELPFLGFSNWIEKCIFSFSQHNRDCKLFCQQQIHFLMHLFSHRHCKKKKKPSPIYPWKYFPYFRQTSYQSRGSSFSSVFYTPADWKNYNLKKRGDINCWGYWQTCDVSSNSIKPPLYWSCLESSCDDLFLPFWLRKQFTYISFYEKESKGREEEEEKGNQKKEREKRAQHRLLFCLRYSSLIEIVFLFKSLETWHRKQQSG